MTGTPRPHDGNGRGITRRGLMLAGIQLGVVTTLALKLRSMQVEQAEQYRMLADGNSIKIRLLVPARGLIHDRNGIVIAGNEQNYRVTLTREEAGGDVEPVLRRLAKLIPISDARMAELLRTGASDVDLSPMVHVADALTLGRRVVTEAFDF